MKKLFFRNVIGLSMSLIVAGCGTAATISGSTSFLDLEKRGNQLVEQTEGIQPRLTLLMNADVRDGEGNRYHPGYVLFDSHIREVGSGEPSAIPEGAVAVDLGGAIVTPGLIDTHSHLGVYARPSAKSHSDGNEATGATTAGVWAEHSVWPQDPGFQLALRGGVTTLHVLPGSANLIGGRGVTLHVVPRLGSRAMRLEGAPSSVKMACGENPKRVYGRRSAAPSTRMGNLRGQRQAFLDAQYYLRERKKKGIANLPRKLDMETLVGVLEGDILPQIHCYRADDMLSMLQLADEFGFRIRSFHHALEAYKIADILAEKSVSVSTWADWWGFKMEANDAVMANAAIVHAAGGKAIIHSDSSVGIQRLNQEAAKALREGRRAGLDVDESDALQWITLNPAWALGVEEQVGSLVTGKRSDLIIWKGEPLSVYGAPELVYVDGVETWNRSQPPAPWSDFSVTPEVE